VAITTNTVPTSTPKIIPTVDADFEVLGLAFVNYIWHKAYL
jgi:hypothetical protein